MLWRSWRIEGGVSKLETGVWSSFRDTEGQRYSRVEHKRGKEWCGHLSEDSWRSE